MYHKRLSGDGRTIFHLDPFVSWESIAKMSRVLCEDGIERTIIVRDNDTYFSTPGKTKAHGKTVTGFVSYDSDLERFTFKAYTYGKNADVIQPKNA